MQAIGSQNGSSGSDDRGPYAAAASAGRLSPVSLERLFGRPPPHALEAERSLLGSLLLDPKVLGDVLRVVDKPEQFYSEANGAIFKAILDVYDKHRSGDLVQVADALRGRGLLDPVGGEHYLVDLAGMVPSARNAERYATIVADKAKLRRLIDAAGTILHEAYDGGEDGLREAGEVIDSAEQAVFEIAQEQASSGPQRLAALVGEEMLRIERQAEGRGIAGVATGFNDLDEMLGGLQPGEMVIVAARPSMGKTALALNMAEQVAFGGRSPWQTLPTDEQEREAGFQPAGFFSLEMGRGALAQRLLSARSGIDAHRLRMGDVGEKDWQALDRAASQLYEAPLYIDDTPGLTVLQLRAKARRMVDQFKLRAIFIDYMQLLTAPNAARESRQVEVSTISRQIKSLARELNVPVVCLAQLNRGAEQREGHRPRMSDLRESGSIEQDADVVMLLHREAYYHRGDPQWDPTSPEFDEDNRDKLNLAELIIAKQRNGPTGTVKLVWDDRTTRFKNHDAWRDDFDAGGAAASAPSAASWAADPGTRSTTDTTAASASALPERAEPHATPADRSAFFAPGERNGPAEDHRDGGGPDHGDEDDDLPF